MDTGAMGHAMTQQPANAELTRLMAKPKGRQHINRSTPEKRTWNGVVYDSRDEMLFHQDHPWMTRCQKGERSLDIGALGTYTPDFMIIAKTHGCKSTVIEIKGPKVFKAKLHKRTGKMIPERVKPHWTGEARMRFLRAQEIYYQDAIFQVMVRHAGQWLEVKP